jgi:hypothetical protein
MRIVPLIFYRRAQTPILEGLNRIEQMVSTLVIALPAPVPVAPATVSVHSGGNDHVT